MVKVSAMQALRRAMRPPSAKKNKKDIHEFGQRFADLTVEVREYFCTNSIDDIHAVQATHNAFAEILRFAAYDYGRDTSRWEWQDEIDKLMEFVDRKKLAAHNAANREKRARQLAKTAQSTKAKSAAAGGK
jgi:hypothetical protein